MNEEVSEAMPEVYSMNLRINDVSNFREEYREYKLKLTNKEDVKRNQTFETIQDIMNNSDLTMNEIERWDECTIYPNGKVRGFSYGEDSQDMAMSVGVGV